MNTVEWSGALSLDFEPMDAEHREFVDLLAKAQRATDADLPAAWAALVDHTVGHFGREDEWMRGTRFSSTESHTMQHRVVLNLLREGLAMAQAGRIGAVREMADELAVWFVKHTQSLDAALALHLRRQPESFIRTVSNRKTGDRSVRAPPRKPAGRTDSPTG